MASELKAAVVPLNGKNYPTWKIQCRMALMKEKLWKIVDGTEATPGTDGTDATHIGWNCSERVRTKVSTSRKATNNKMKANRDETERQQQLGQ